MHGYSYTNLSNKFIKLEEIFDYPVGRNPELSSGQ